MERKKIINYLKATFYPRKLTCLACGREIFYEETFCETCEKEVFRNDGDVCDFCGRKTSGGAKICGYCRSRGVNFECARSVFVYKGVVKRLIRRLKYDGEKYIAEELAPFLYERYLKIGVGADEILYAPMTEKAKRKRGYNQSEEIAKSLGKLAGIPVEERLKKTKETESQVGLGKTEREKNLSGAFRVINKKEIKGKTFLLTDDVMTTGSTLNELAKILVEAGAEKVVAVTVASTEEERAM